MDPNPKPGTGWNEALRQPALARIVPATPAVPVQASPPAVPTRAVPPPPPPPSQPLFTSEPPLMQRPAKTPKRSILPMVFLLLLTVGSMAAAGYFAMENEATKDKLAEANRNTVKAQDEYLSTAGSMVAERESEWERTKSAWAAKEKELTLRTTTAENEAASAKSGAIADIDRAKSARTAAETRLASVQAQLASANSDVSRLRSQLANSERKGDDVLKTTNTEVRSWMQGLIAPLPQLDTREEVRVALRKHEMAKLFDAEKKKLDKTVIVATGTIALAERGESGQAFRGVSLRYTTLSAPMPASIVEASYAYRWSMNANSTSFDPDRDSEIATYGLPASSDDAAKEVRFEYKKSDEKYLHFESLKPFDYKIADTRMVLAVKFKERGDLKTQRLLIFKATAVERGK